MTRTLDQAFNWTLASNARNRLTNIYEPIQPYLLVEFARHLDCSVFVDIGANIGFYSVIMSSELEALTIYAYEPMPQAYKELQENLALNALSDRSLVRKVALSSQVGEAEMLVVSNLSGANAIRDTSYNKENSSLKTERVPISTLDEELSLTGQNVSMKIDVEGHEAEVLRGGRRFLQENTCIIQFESLSKDSYHEDCIDILTSLGYRELIAVGPDHYFSNMSFNARDVTSWVSNALSRFVEDSKKPSLSSTNQPIRRRIFRGVTVELSSGLSRRLKKLFQRNST
jgi:FkbM family methyltransferase